MYIFVHRRFSICFDHLTKCWTFQPTMFDDTGGYMQYRAPLDDPALCCGD